MNMDANTNDLFITGKNLPKPLNKKEIYGLLIKMQEGDKTAREKIIHHNIRLVLHRVVNRFKTVKYDLKDLVSVGVIGLIKAVDSFDISKNIEFATYASSCIDNEILMFLRKLQKDQMVASLDMPINVDNQGNELFLDDIISDDTDIEEDFVNDDTRVAVRNIVENMQGRDREIVMLHFGFYDDRRFTQIEIADKFNITQSYVSRLITRIVKRLGVVFREQGIIDGNISADNKQKEQIGEKEGKINMGKQLQSIYDYFKNYSKEQIDEMLLKLTDEERNLIKLRYGEDLENPVADACWNAQYGEKFYGSLIPKMKRLLANPTNERKPRERKVKPVTATHAPGVKPQTVEKPVEKVAVQEAQVENEQISKDVYTKMLELLRTPIFSSLLKVLDPKEAMIVSLKLGYIDEKYFSNKAIAEFLEIDSQEVVDIMTRVLSNYKKMLNLVLDEVIEITTNDSKQPYTLKN